jgi:hypothetical protein
MRTNETGGAAMYRDFDDYLRATSCEDDDRENLRECEEINRAEELKETQRNGKIYHRN